MTRPETISRILTLTNKVGQTEYFDRLAEREDAYLTKLLKVVEKLAK